MKKIIFLLAISLSLFLNACNNKSSNATKDNKQDEVIEISLKHAKEFKIEKHGDKTLVKIHKKGEEGVFNTFNLVNNKAEDKLPNSIPVPCKRIVCLSSTQLSYFLPWMTLMIS